MWLVFFFFFFFFFFFNPLFKTEHLGTLNMLNSQKTCTTALESIPMIWKISVLVCLKFYECLLTHWLPMTTILFVIRRIYSDNFNCHYLRNEKKFWMFCCISESYIKWSTISKKRWPSNIMYLRDCERCG